MPFLDVEGARIYYEVDGQASSPAILLIHAGIANLRMWDPQIAGLAADHYVIRFDTRGFGATEAEDVPFSNRADALALLDHLGVERATLVGSSRGGSIALDITVDTPSRVRGLVTIGSGPSGFPDTELTEREDELFDELDALLEAKDWAKLVRREAALWDFGPERRAEDLDPGFVATAYRLNEPNARHMLDNPTSIPLDPPAYDRAVDIEVPCLIMVGDYDISEILAQYEYLTTAIPNADGCRFRDAAHLPSVEQPEEFERVLLAWLREHAL